MLLRILVIVWLARSVFGIENDGKTFVNLNSDKLLKTQLLARHSDYGNQRRFSFEDQKLSSVERPIKFEDESADYNSGQIKFKYEDYLDADINDNNDIFKESAGKMIKFDEPSEDVSNKLKPNHVNKHGFRTVKKLVFHDSNKNADNFNEFTEGVPFQDNGININNKDPQKKRKPKRRRKQPSQFGTGPQYSGGFSGYGLYQGVGYPLPGDPIGTYPQYAGGNYYGYPNHQSYQGVYPNPQYANGNFGPYNPGNPAYNSDFQGYQNYYKPTRRPKSWTSQAVSAVVDAFTSIAMYDDYQCVPRLLCEAAGGRATGSSSTLLSAASGLQPLLTMLSGYNGASSSPLFVFGRAVILGATSNGNAATCRYAYPQCPTDPEQLIYYLNNHNGGFFRFFNSPQQQTQNLEQFYGHLAGQYGLHQPNRGQQGYGFQNQIGYGLQNQNLYGNTQQYGSNYAYNQNNDLYDKYKNSINSKYIEDRIQNKPVNENYSFYDDGIKDDYIENRIQNKPVNDLEDIQAEEDLNTKWLFPGEGNFGSQNNGQKELGKRGSKTLKFPDESPTGFSGTDHVSTSKSIVFPGKYINYLQNLYNYAATTEVSLKDYEFDRKHNFYVKKEKPIDSYKYKRPYNYNTKDVNGYRTVYIVRGNGDPNHPEILKIKEGQSV